MVEMEERLCKGCGKGVKVSINSKQQYCTALCEEYRNPDPGKKQKHLLRNPSRKESIYIKTGRRD